MYANPREPHLINRANGQFSRKYPSPPPSTTIEDSRVAFFPPAIISPLAAEKYNGSRMSVKTIRPFPSPCHFFFPSFFASGKKGCKQTGLVSLSSPAFL